MRKDSRKSVTSKTRQSKRSSRRKSPTPARQKVVRHTTRPPTNHQQSDEQCTDLESRLALIPVNDAEDIARGYPRAKFRQISDGQAARIMDDHMRTLFPMSYGTRQDGWLTRMNLSARDLWYGDAGHDADRSTIVKVDIEAYCDEADKDEGDTGGRWLHSTGSTAVQRVKNRWTAEFVKTARVAKGAFYVLDLQQMDEDLEYYMQVTPKLWEERARKNGT